MQITENPEEILIKHIPVRKWIIGGILTFFTGIFCLFLFFAFLSAPRGFYASLLGEGIGFLSFLFAAVLFLIILFFEIKMIHAPLATIIISKKTDCVDITYQRFYGTQKQRFYIHQIQKFKSYKGKLIFSSAYFLALVLANKKVVKLNVPIGDEKKEITAFIKKLNKFIKSKISVSR